MEVRYCSTSLMRGEVEEEGHSRIPSSNPAVDTTAVDTVSRTDAAAVVVGQADIPVQDQDTPLQGQQVVNSSIDEDSSRTRVHRLCSLAHSQLVAEAEASLEAADVAAADSAASTAVVVHMPR